MKTLDNSPILLSAGSAAALLEIGHTTFYKLVKEGRLPAIRFSRRLVRYRQSDLEALITSRLSGGEK